MTTAPTQAGPATVAPAGAREKSAAVLIADDQADLLEALRMLLKGRGYRVTMARSVPEVEAALGAQDFDAALIDLNYARDTTSGREGLELIQRMAAADPTLPVLVMTAWGTVDGAVAALQRGARDYITKPWDNGRLLSSLATQIELGRALRQARRLGEESERRLRVEGASLAPAESPAMARLVHVVERVAPSDANVLITGEHGSGKEVVARHIHAASLRARQPFVAVNAGALSDGVFESELFGHVRGAFTDARTDRTGCFELAHEGTLFLDEIGTMPPGQQAKLLRVLQAGEVQPVGSSKHRKVDVRILAATNVDLAKQVALGQFREDLLYRLNTVELRLPALRERREDILPLARRFLTERAARYRKPLTGFAVDALNALLHHPWPGNVRELEHAIERAVLMATGCEVHAEDLALTPRANPAAPGEALTDMTLDQAEAFLIRQALRRAEGDATRAAQHLGLSRSALYRRLQRFGIEPVA
jgi:DNA-binding NtrC family response regulator